MADVFEPQIRALLVDWPKMPAPIIAERIGWPHSLSPLKKRLQLIRPEYVGVDPVDRFVYKPGAIAQCDLRFPETPIPVGGGQERILPVLVMVLWYSRFITAVMIPSRQGGDILSGMWELISQLGRVLKTLVWDRESAIGGTGKVTTVAAAFAGTLATRIQLAPPRDPEYKGVVERANGYLETSFLPGRRFTSPTDFNIQLQDWLTRANTRTVRAIGGRPVDLLTIDVQAMIETATAGSVDRAHSSDPVGAGLLRACRGRRLFGRSAGDRSIRRCERQPDDGDSSLRRTDRCSPRPLVGETCGRHRS